MISDFGLCAVRQRSLSLVADPLQALKDNQSSFNTTQVGTIGWVAPEVLRNERTVSPACGLNSGSNTS